MYISLGFPDSEFAIHKFGRHEIPEIQNEKTLTISEQDLLNYILETNSSVLFNDKEYLKLIEGKSQDEIDFFMQMSMLIVKKLNKCFLTHINKLVFMVQKKGGLQDWDAPGGFWLGATEWEPYFLSRGGQIVDLKVRLGSCPFRTLL